MYETNTILSNEHNLELGGITGLTFTMMFVVLDTSIGTEILSYIPQMDQYLVVFKL